METREQEIEEKRLENFIQCNDLLQRKTDKAGEK